MAAAMTSTVRLNLAWARRTCDERGGVAGFADAIDTDRSTVYRHLQGGMEAGPRFIAAVLTAYPVMFDDAFDVVLLPSQAGRGSAA